MAANFFMNQQPGGVIPRFEIAEFGKMENASGEIRVFQSDTAVAGELGRQG